MCEWVEGRWWVVGKFVGGGVMCRCVVCVRVLDMCMGCV